MILYYIAVVGPLLHWFAEGCRAIYKLWLECRDVPNYSINGAPLGIRDICYFTSYEFIYLCFIFCFVSVPIFCWAFIHENAFDYYVHRLRCIHHAFIRFLLNASAKVCFVLSIVLIVLTCFHGYQDLMDL